MKRIAFLLRQIVFSFFSVSVVAPAYAQDRTFNVSGWFEGGITLSEITTNLFGTLRGTVVFLAATVFIIGAFYMTLGFNSENQSKGKSMMIGSLVGLAIVLAAWAIFNTVYYFTQV